MSSKSDFIRWWTNYGEMADEEIEYPAFQAGRAFQHSVESAELATLRAQLAEAREANERLVWRMKWIDDNPNDNIALRFALDATDKEIDDIKHKVTTA